MDLPLIMLSFCLALNSATEFDHSYLIRNDSCSTSTPVCHTLQEIFTNSSLQHNDTIFELEEGYHSLASTDGPYCFTLQNLSNITFRGSGTIVSCGPRVGLKFVGMVSITFCNISFINCGAKQASTSPKKNGSFEEFLVALYFKECESVFMKYVDITSSTDATGVTFYDSVGNNIFLNCTFANNSFNMPSVSEEDVGGGGGGVYVEFTYCKPNTICNDSAIMPAIDDAIFNFTECTFINNIARTIGASPKSIHILPHRMHHRSFGHGGGLSFFVRGNNSNIILNVDSCCFKQNKAHWGGGIYVQLNYHAHGNYVKIKNSNFVENNCPFSNGTMGGGIRLTDYVHEFDYSSVKNEFIIENCEFKGNNAMKGGAISISWAHQDTTSDTVTNFAILNTSFMENFGKLGSAVYIDQKEANIEGLVGEIMLQNCTFFNNSANFYEQLIQSLPVEIGLGALYTASSTVKIYGSVHFEENVGTALAIADSNVVFEVCNATFFNNRGYDGGG